MAQDLGMVGAAVEMLIDAGGERIGIKDPQAQGIESSADLLEPLPVARIVAEQHRQVLPGPVRM